MRAIAVDALLGATVLAAWIGCAGYARLRSAQDRLHCVAFVAAAAGLPLAAAAFVADGVSGRALRLLFLVVVTLVASAALAHATGRALLLRDAAREEGE